jgi:hypothetical protein
MRTRTHRGFTIVETLVVALALFVLVAVTLPALATVSCDRGREKSAANLRALGVAHGMYAADWSDRQFTLVRDDLGEHHGRCDDYQSSKGCHPPVILGDDCDGATRGYYFDCEGSGGSCGNFPVVKPLNFTGSFASSGSFRLPGARGFHEYVTGRFYDPTFFAPKDEVVLELVAPLFEEDCEWVESDETLIFSASYVLSPAAMYDPAVFAPERDGGWRDPDDLDDGYRSPTVSQALYPHQKTRMIEHHWLQRPPERCNPGFDGPYGGCQPYFFNHGLRSIPLALLYDGSVDDVSVMEAMESNTRVETQTDGWERLWSVDTPWGHSGYFTEYGYDLAQTSYHILTTGGIRGRDTIR